MGRGRRALGLVGAAHACLDAFFHPRLEYAEAQQRSQPAHAPDLRDRARRHRHVGLDAGDAGGDERGVDVAPGDGDGGACVHAAAEAAHLPRQRHLDHAAVDARAAALAQALDAGLGGARTHAAAAVEGQHQLVGARQARLQHRREAVGRHHVEADARRDHDAGGLGALVLRVAVREDIDLAGDVQIMHVLGQTGFQQRRAGRRERPGAVEHRADVVEAGGDRLGTQQRKHPLVQAQFARQRFQRLARAAGQQRLQPGVHRGAGDQRTGIAVGAVDHQLCAHRGFLARTAAVRRRK